MSLQSLVVNSEGTVLSFTDSGHPGSDSYTTVFAVHGIIFNGLIFKRVQALSASSNIRFVAINRRRYAGSTPYSDTESSILMTGSDEEKARWIDARGLELANFVDTFIQDNQLPPISADGNSGGVALLGWSSGNQVTASAIANLDKLSTSSQNRFTAYLRAYIMHEPPTIIFGLPRTPKTRSPDIEETILAEKRTPMTMWLTSYFDHGDLSSRDPNILKHIVPSARRRPTIHDMTADEIAEIVDESFKLPSFPKLGDATGALPLAAFFNIQDDNAASGGNIKFVVIPGANHFFQWDDAKDALKAYVEAL
ncbi:hypothetical protein B0H10DRAFT_2211017 [Mycena sp. CBHHK59/15]|nr:hypothetical protein B0H10DRAFT_2211017 [Mycena sp. CBHHK59/15]